MGNCWMGQVLLCYLYIFTSLPHIYLLVQSTSLVPFAHFLQGRVSWLYSFIQNDWEKEITGQWMRTLIFMYDNVRMTVQKHFFAMTLRFVKMERMSFLQRIMGASTEKNRYRYHHPHTPSNANSRLRNGFLSPTKLTYFTAIMAHVNHLTVIILLRLQY